MAVPTISSVTPSSIPPMSGAMIKVEGTNFNFWTSLPVPNAGMSATIGTATAAVKVCDGTLLFVVAPTRDAVEGKTGPETLTLTLKNLDADGDPVPGEEVSASIVYDTEAFIAPDAEPFICKVLRKFATGMKAHFNIPVAMSTDVDFTVDGEMLRVTPEPPAIVVTDFSLEKSAMTVDQVVKDLRRYRNSMIFTMRGSLTIVAKNFYNALAYFAAVQMFHQRSPYFQVEGLEGLKVKFRLDNRAEMGLNVREGIKTWSVGFSLEPVIVETPEEIDIAFLALSRHITVYGT